MSKVTVTAENKTCTRLRVSIDGVRLMSLGPGTKRTESKSPSPGPHVLSWVAVGNKGATYSVTLGSPAGQQCHHQGVVGKRGLDHGACPFDVS